MPTSTSQSPPDDEVARLDSTLDALADAAGSSVVEPLADLGRLAAAQLRERWPRLPTGVRLSATLAMRDDAEQHVERTYHRALLVALGDTDADVRLAALDGLTELDSLDFLEVLLQVVAAEPDERVRAAMAVALGRFALLAELGQLPDDAAARVRDRLLALHDRDSAPEVRRRALESFGYFAGDETVATRIERAHASREHALCVSAIYAMGRQADPRWADIVRAALASDEPEIRFEAVTAAGSIGGELMILPLIDMVRDEDLEVRLAAIAAIGSIGGTLAINTLRRLANDDSPAIADAASDALEEAMLTASPLRPLM
jgi:HEAT repeat protein